ATILINGKAFKYNPLTDAETDSNALSKKAFTTLTLIIGAVILLPFATVEIFYYGFPKVETWKAGLSIIYLVIGATILAYWFWNRALESVSASVSGLYLNALPLISIVA
ncbi:EamA family transporter, partial [Bacillus sp. D-CC]